MKIIDLHCDTISNGIVLSEGKETLASWQGHINIEKLKKGGSFIQFFALFIPKKETDLQGVMPESTYERFFYSLKCYNHEIKNNQNELAPVLKYSDIAKNEAEGKISSVLTLEGGDALGDNLEHVGGFYNEGVRLITLTWNDENELGYPNSLDNQTMRRGLKPFGIEVVEEMNRIGMLIDVSHLSEGGFYDVIKVSNKPILASHSCAKSLCDHPRNLADEQLKLLGDSGGVAGVNFYHKFLNSNCESSLTKDIIDHMVHIKQKAGIDAVALGSDFDGIDSCLEFSDFSGYPQIVEAMGKQFTSSEIENICYKNVLRLMKDVFK